MHKLKGYIMVIIASSFWGISGTVAQSLFSEDKVTVEWLVTVRLLISGILFLLYVYFKNGKEDLFQIFRNKSYVLHFVIFGILGMFSVQYTFFVAINEGNAAVATLLQYIAPVFIMIYYLIVLKLKPMLVEMLAVVLALSGTFLILTNGSLQAISISMTAFWWGISSAVALAFYLLYSGFLVKQFSSFIVMGYGMLIGGLASLTIHFPLTANIKLWDWKTIVSIVFIIIFGTIVPFFLYSESLRYINAKETSLLGCTEPLAAIIVSIIWLGTPFGINQAIGSLFIMIMVLLLSLRKPKNSAAIRGK